LVLQIALVIPVLCHRVVDDTIRFARLIPQVGEGVLRLGFED
jgi:hypothetical protein